MKFLETGDTLATAAAKAGMDQKTASKWGHTINRTETYAKPQEPSYVEVTRGPETTNSNLNSFRHELFGFILSRNMMATRAAAGIWFQSASEIPICASVSTAAD